MKAVVDQKTCVGCGLCVDTCSAVFEMDDNVAKVIVETVPDDAVEACKEAATSCPVESITIKE